MTSDFVRSNSSSVLVVMENGKSGSCYCTCTHTNKKEEVLKITPFPHIVTASKHKLKQIENLIIFSIVRICSYNNYQTTMQKKSEA